MSTNIILNGWNNQKLCLYLYSNQQTNDMYIIEVNNIYRDEKTLYQVNTTIFPTDVQKIVDEAHEEALKVGAYYCKFRDELGKYGIVEVNPVVIVEIPK